MPRTLTLAEKLALLLEYGEGRGLAVTYRAIGEATGENANNIRKIHRGENANPGLKTLKALADYFGVGLAYFDLETRAACQDYLKQAPKDRLVAEIALRTLGVSEAGLEAIQNMVDIVRKSEGLPPSKGRSE